MPDINKQIEEQARKILFKANKLPPEANYFGSVDHIKYSSNEILKLSEELELSSRWRKVSEELPEVKDENFFINIKRYDNEFRIDAICVFAEMEDVKGYLEFNNVDSWKPID